MLATMAASQQVARIVTLNSITKRSASSFVQLRNLSTGADRSSYLSGLTNFDRRRGAMSRPPPEEVPRYDSNIITAAAATIDGTYVSPFQDIFDRMYSNGPTTLGTTDEYVEFQKERAKHQKILQCGIPEHLLRFTTTSFGRTLIAPHVHPNEHRVILKINTKNLPFATTSKGGSSTEMEILREIVGNRLNDERQELRLTSNQFGSRMENKRHLVSMLDRIVLSCQRLGAELKKSDGTAAAPQEEKKETL